MILALFLRGDNMWCEKREGGVLFLSAAGRGGFFFGIRWLPTVGYAKTLPYFIYAAWLKGSQSQRKFSKVFILDGVRRTDNLVENSFLISVVRCVRAEIRMNATGS